MGNRLSKIYTRTGDSGSTGLAGGERVRKYDLRIECCGEVDELNSAIGVALAQPDFPSDATAILIPVQHELFEIGGEVAMPDYRGLSDQSVARLESELDALNSHLEPLREFLLPGGTQAAAACHLARSICRRAERRLWQLTHQQGCRELLATYLNRLSDLLFVLARSVNAQDGGPETSWDHERDGSAAD